MLANDLPERFIDYINNLIDSYGLAAGDVDNIAFCVFCPPALQLPPETV